MSVWVLLEVDLHPIHPISQKIVLWFYFILFFQKKKMAQRKRPYSFTKIWKRFIMEVFRFNKKTKTRGITITLIIHSHHLILD